MNMSWFEGLIYGLISGISEFLPISSHAHQRILMLLFGVESRDPVRDLLVHLAILLSVYSGCRGMIEHLRRETQQKARSGKYMHTARSHLDLRLVKNAAVPMLIGLLVLTYIFGLDGNLLVTALFLLINGIILYIPDRMMQGNKDARSMSVFDSFLIGSAGALSAFTGISRIGGTVSVAVARGADRQNALNWSLILCIPALIALSGIDVIRIFSAAGSLNVWGNFLSYLLSAAGAYFGGCFGIRLIKSLTVRIGLSGFSFYSWGAALLSFVLYLTVV